MTTVVKPDPQNFGNYCGYHQTGDGAPNEILTRTGPGTLCGEFLRRYWHPFYIASEVGEKIPDEELREMLEEADRDGDGMLSFEEFYRIMRRRGDPLDDFD